MHTEGQVQSSSPPFRTVKEQTGGEDSLPGPLQSCHFPGSAILGERDESSIRPFIIRQFPTSGWESSLPKTSSLLDSGTLKIYQGHNSPIRSRTVALKEAITTRVRCSTEVYLPSKFTGVLNTHVFICFYFPIVFWAGGGGALKVTIMACYSSRF